MRILIVGGNGYIGSLLRERLLRHGHSILVFDRRAPVLGGPPFDFFVGDRDNPRDLTTVAREDYDAVVDLVAYRPSQSRLLAAHLSGRTGRLLHLSSIAVYRDVLCDRASEAQAVRLSHFDSSYASQKLQCELEVERASERGGFSTVILRAAPIMGAGDVVSRENYFLKRLLLRQAILHPGPLDGNVQYIYIDDLVLAICRALVSRSSTCATYHLVASDCPTLRAHIRAIGELAGVTDCRIQEADPQALVAYGFRLPAFPYLLCGDRRLESSRAMADLDLEFASYERALSSTVGWLMNNDPLRYPCWPGRSSTQSLLCGTNEILHAELERLFLEGRQAEWVPSAEYVLEALSGTGEWDASWSIAAPEGLVATLFPEGPMTMLDQNRHFSRCRSFAPEPLMNTECCGDEMILMASIDESTDESHGRAMWLHCQTHVRRSDDLGRTCLLGFSHDNVPTTFRCAAFSDLVLRSVKGDVPTLVSVSTSRDLSRLEGWLLECDASGVLRCDSLCGMGSVFLHRACRWIPATVLRGCIRRPDRNRFSGSDLPADSPLQAEACTEVIQSAGIWASAFTLARLLQRTGRQGPIELRLSSALNGLFLGLDSTTLFSTRRFRPCFILFQLGRHFFAAQLGPQRLFELTEPLAMVCEVMQRASGWKSASDAIRGYRGVSAMTAGRMLREAYDRLVGIGLRFLFSGDPPCDDEA
jgi:nucleoside-diphosphate-sugar epimerase